MTQYEINIRDYWRVVRKRKTIILFTTISLGLFSFILSYIKRPIPVFESFASVKIERSATLAGLYLETISWNPEDNIATQVEVIKSFPIMEKVAREMAIIDSTYNYDQILSDEQSVNKVLDLMSTVRAEQDGMTNLINIFVQSDSPLLSQQIANTTARVYTQRSNLQKNERAINALSFISNQLEEVGQKLKTAEENVRQFREEKNVITLENKADMISRELEHSRFELNRLRQRRIQLDMVIERLSKQQDIPIENFIELDYENQSQTYVNLANQLAQLYVKRDNLLINYTPNHPDVKQAENRIRELLKSIIRELKGQRISLAHLEDVMSLKIDQLNSEYQQIPRNELELTRLQRKVQINNELYTFLESKHQEALIKNAEKINETTIVKPALSGYNINPPPPIVMTVGLGLFIGFLLGMVVAFVYESMDTSFGTIEEVEKFLDVPVLAIVPHIDARRILERIKGDLKNNRISEYILELNAMLMCHFAPKSAMAESYRALRTNIQHLTVANKMKTLVFTSSSMREGKSTTIANLAITISQIGFKTLLVDADLRKPTIHKTFGLHKEPGLTNILLGTAKWEDCLMTITDIMMGKLNIQNIMNTPGIDNLHIITSGSHPLTPSELLESRRMNEFLEFVKGRYDIILIDSPPVLPATDSAILAAKVDGVVLVYQIGRTARGALKRTKVQLENINAKILGVVLNSLKAEMSMDYKDFRYHEYGYGEETEQSAKDGNGEFVKRVDSIRKKVANGAWKNVKVTFQRHDKN